ncbi:hypothetical protein AAES_09054 [Amazona aestiva]|uniref:Uncharacterized protein n=1 Tax=Amazona aestiva TaxID=12930 RepID=A0A0Q3U328_AMAAE|nr:hypothetical protein AAES_09054 [Amazona aestiva]
MGDETASLTEIPGAVAGAPQLAPGADNEGEAAASLLVQVFQHQEEPAALPTKEERQCVEDIKDMLSGVKVVNLMNHLGQPSGPRALPGPHPMGLQGGSSIHSRVGMDAAGEEEAVALLDEEEKKEKQEEAKQELEYVSHKEMYQGIAVTREADKARPPLVTFPGCSARIYLSSSRRRSDPFKSKLCAWAVPPPCFSCTALVPALHGPMPLTMSTLGQAGSARTVDEGLPRTPLPSFVCQGHEQPWRQSPVCCTQVDKVHPCFINISNNYANQSEPVKKAFTFHGTAAFDVEGELFDQLHDRPT